jgi:hypothetical protein
MSFYITLPSSTQSTGTTSNFITDLACPITLNQRYKVALVELLYNHSWKINLGNLHIYTQNDRLFIYELSNIPIFLEDSFTISALIDKLNIEIKNSIIKLFYNKRYEERQDALLKQQANVPSYPISNYDSPVKNLELIEEIKKTNEYINAPNFKLEDKKLIFYFRSSPIKKIVLEGRILSELGYDETIALIEPSNETLVLDRPIDQTKKIKIIGPIYIYAPDLIEYQFVGNTRAPLLRTAVVEPTPDDKIIWINFDRPHYVDVKENVISKIKIIIKDEYDDEIAFDYSSLTLKLHFIPA